MSVFRADVAVGPERPPGSRPPLVARQAGSLSLELVLAIPIVALVLVSVLAAVGVARDALLVHEAARVAVRTAATTTGTTAVRDAVAEASNGHDVRVRVTPTGRRAGDLVRVTTSLLTEVGPFARELTASTVARVEPGVGP